MAIPINSLLAFSCVGLRVAVSDGESVQYQQIQMLETAFSVNEFSAGASSGGIPHASAIE
jgi:hypothetical protein